MTNPTTGWRHEQDVYTTTLVWSSMRYTLLWESKREVVIRNRLIPPRNTCHCGLSLPEGIVVRGTASTCQQQGCY